MCRYGRRSLRCISLAQKLPEQKSVLGRVWGGGGKGEGERRGEEIRERQKYMVEKSKERLLKEKDIGKGPKRNRGGEKFGKGGREGGK